MKKKHVLLVMLVSLLTAGLFFVSCEEDSKDADIAGTWELWMTRAEMAKAIASDMEMTEAEAEAFLQLMNFPSRALVMELVFNAFNNTVRIYEVDPKDGEKELEGIGTYTQTGNTVTVTMDGETFTGTISGSRLNVIEDGETMSFTKK